MDGFISDTGGVWQKYLVCYWEPMSPLSNYRKTGFGGCKSIFPGTTCIPGELKKIGCDISKDVSQQVPVQNVNKELPPRVLQEG